MISIPFVAVAVVLAAMPAQAQTGRSAAAPDRVGESSVPAGASLPWRLLELENGFAAILQRDTTLPLAAVELFVRGGARVERDGQRGFAHLLEHVLPTPRRFHSHPANRDNFRNLWIGSNAGVERDFLRFHTEIRSEGLELAIAELADRVQSDSSWYNTDAVTREAEIVVNELSRAWRIDWEPAVEPLLNAGTFGPLHPYAHVVGGLAEDVRAATVDDMLDWHARFFGASNLLLVVVGDFDYGSAEDMVRRHFAPLRAGTRIVPGERRIPRAQAARSAVEIAGDRGAVFLRWPVPEWGSADAGELIVLAELLTDRLRRSARALPEISDASAEVSLHEIAGLFNVQATITDGAAVALAEDMLRSELRRIVSDQPAPAEVSAAAARAELQLLRNLERPVWRGGRAEALAMGFLYHGDPDRYREQLAGVSNTTAAGLRRAARRWLSRDGYLLQVLPQPDRSAKGSIVRSAPVAVAVPRPFVFPPISELLLDNGVRVLAVERRQMSLTSLTLIIFPGDAPGVSAEALRRTLDPPRGSVPPGATDPLAPGLADLGADVSFESGNDAVRISITLPGRHVGSVLELLSTALDADRLQVGVGDGDAGRAGETAAEAASLAERRVRGLHCLLWGHGCSDGSAEAAPNSVGMHVTTSAQEFGPAHDGAANAVLLIAGDFHVEELKAILDGTLGGWNSGNGRNRRSAFDGASGYPGEAALVEQRGMAQSHILFGQLLPGGPAVDPLLARLVGQALRERLMDNLRHDKAWIYEVWPWDTDISSQATVLHFNLPVRTEMAGAAISEIKREIRHLQQHPVSGELLARVKRYVGDTMITRGLLATDATVDQLALLAVAGLPLDYHPTAHRRLRELTAEDLMVAAGTLLDADRTVWVLTGDPLLMEAALDEAGIPVRARLSADR